MRKLAPNDFPLTIYKRAKAKCKNLNLFYFYLPTKQTDIGLIELKDAKEAQLKNPGSLS
jgi:hypothetical protein